MFPSSKWAALALLGGLGGAMMALPAEACEPVGAPAQRSLRAAWEEAIDALVEATAESGQPWSCTGGSIELELIDDGAILRVQREGAEPMARHVATPEDLVPTGKAMLAVLQVALPSQPPPAPAPTPPERKEVRATPSRPAPTVASARPAEPSRPRLLVDAVGAFRYQGAVDALSAGGRRPARRASRSLGAGGVGSLHRPGRRSRRTGSRAVGARSRPQHRRGAGGRTGAADGGPVRRRRRDRHGGRGGSAPPTRSSKWSCAPSMAGSGAK